MTFHSITRETTTIGENAYLFISFHFLGMFLEKYCFCFYKQTGDERLSTNFFRISRRSAWSDSTSSSITRRTNQFPQFPYSWLDFSCTRYGYEIEYACERSSLCQESCILWVGTDYYWSFKTSASWWGSTDGFGSFLLGMCWTGFFFLFQSERC